MGTSNPKFSRVDAEVAEYRRQTREAITQCFAQPETLVANFQQFLHVFDVEPETFAQKQLQAFDDGMEKLPLNSPLALKHRIHPAIRAVIEATSAFQKISDEIEQVCHDEVIVSVLLAWL